MNPDYSKQDRWYVNKGVTPPEHSAHGTPEEIRANLQQAKCTNWRLDGNRLIADTDLGQLVQYISPEYICRGTDNKGLPILEKVVL